MIKLKEEKTLTITNQWQILKQLQRRVVKVFLDLIVLYRLRSISYINGYDLVGYVYKKTHILLSPGTVYSTLYSMERKGLIRGIWKEKRRNYYITPQGEEIIHIVNEKNDIINFIFSRFKILDSSE